MRLGAFGAVGVVCAVAVAAMVGASSARADGSSLDPFFERLAAVITENGDTSLPAVQQTVFLQRAALAETLVSSGPAFPPSPCGATGLLDSIGFTTEGLFAAGKVSQGDAATLIEAVASVNGAIVTSYPPSPCNVAFLVPGDS